MGSLNLNHPLPDGVTTPVTCHGVLLVYVVQVHLTVWIHGASSLNGFDIGYQIETETIEGAKLIAPDSMGRRVLGLPSHSMIFSGSPYVRRITARVRRRK